MQVSWIDPEEVAPLAASLRHTTTRRAIASAPEPIEALESVEPLVIEPDESGAESPAVPNLSAFRQRLQSIREKAIQAGLLTPETKPPVEVAASLPVEESPQIAPPEAAFAPGSVPMASEKPPIEIAAGATVKERLEAFDLWAAQEWGPSELLIVDEYGDLLWGPPRKSGLVVSTMMAWNAAIRASAQSASGVSQILQQTLAGGETLTVIPCHTRLGLLQIALVKAQAPDDKETFALKTVLTQIMDMRD